ncbi:MAG: VanW family protein [Clostridia bacterium]|nr:VanW family protein [Clostridia bacterium]
MKEDLVKEANQEIKQEKEEEIVEKNEEKQEDTKFEKIEDKPKHVKEKIKEMDPKKGKKKKIIILCIIGVILVLGIIFSTIFALFNINNEKIINGVTISGVDISKLSKQEAKEKIQNLFEEKKQKDLNLNYQDYENTLSPLLLETEYNVDKAIDEAYNIGRKDNIFINNYEILFTLLGKKNIDVDMSLNEEMAIQKLDEISLNLPGAIIESSYSIEDDEMVITKGKPGIKVENNKLLEEVKNRLNSLENKEDIIQIPVENANPQAIDIDKIHEEVYKEAKDAYYTKDPFTVYPEVIGVDFDVEAAKALLLEDKEEYIIKLTITRPKVTIEQIGSEAFPDQLSTFTTRFDESDRDRSTNLRIACSKINGKVLMPGEIFSYNKTLGARTAAAGFKNGKVYEGGEVVDGIGGGICQISSTLYNAVVMANLQTVERRNHQFVTSYVGPGRDATVVYGAIDFKFKNTRKYPVRLKASAVNGIATVTIYGIKEENEYTFKFETRTVDTIPTTTTYEEDATLPVGTEKVKRKGTNGIKTETYVTKTLNGKVVSRDLLSRDTYSAMTRIVIKGTKGEDTSTPSSPSVQTPQTPVTPIPTEEPKNEEIPVTPSTLTVTETPETKPETPTDNTEANNGN